MQNYIATNASSISLNCTKIAAAAGAPPPSADHARGATAIQIPMLYVVGNEIKRVWTLLFYWVTAWGGLAVSHSVYRNRIIILENNISVGGAPHFVHSPAYGYPLSLANIYVRWAVAVSADFRAKMGAPEQEDCTYSLSALVFVVVVVVIVVVIFVVVLHSHSSDF